MEYHSAKNITPSEANPLLQFTNTVGWNEYKACMVCDACITGARKRIELARRKFWEELPGIFGLPGWNEHLSPEELSGTLRSALSTHMRLLLIQIVVQGNIRLCSSDCGRRLVCHLGTCSMSASSCDAALCRYARLSSASEAPFSSPLIWRRTRPCMNVLRNNYCIHLPINPSLYMASFGMPQTELNGNS